MLKARILTALVLVAGFGSLLFASPPWLWLGFAVVVAGLGAWEWGRLVSLNDGARAAYAVLVASLVMLIAPGGGVASGKAPALAACAVGVIFWLLLAPAWLLRRWHIPAGVAGALLGLILLLPASLALVLLREAYGAAWLLALMASVWLADIAAFFVGRRFGRIKLAPQISPGKSREGAYGAMVGVCLYALALLFLATPVPASPGLVATILVAAVLHTVVSIMGDLFESLAKRQAGVKDSGTLLPGHGGILDRIDSLTSTLPLAALAAHFWLPPS